MKPTKPKKKRIVWNINPVTRFERDTQKKKRLVEKLREKDSINEWNEQKYDHCSR